ncbi:MAG: hypothetical protein NTX40_01590 [Planctomycetota bacterium]|nr:hypothetical protein [Planctomycetota bacterium]
MSIFSYVPLFALGILVLVVGLILAGKPGGGGSREAPSIPQIGVITGYFLFTAIGILALVYGGVVYFILLYKMWAAIPKDRARMSPAAAVGLLFVPLFNLYWYFQVIYGWAQDYNDFIAEREINAPAASEKLASAIPVFPLIGLGIGFIRAISVQRPGDSMDILTGWVVLALGIASVVVSYLFLNRAIDGLNSLARSVPKGTA